MFEKWPHKFCTKASFVFKSKPQKFPRYHKRLSKWVSLQGINESKLKNHGNSSERFLNSSLETIFQIYFILFALVWYKDSIYVLKLSWLTTVETTADKTRLERKEKKHYSLFSVLTNSNSRRVKPALSNAVSLDWREGSLTVWPDLGIYREI